LDEAELAAACRRWSASEVTDENLTREQAIQVWSLRCALPQEARTRFDRLPMATQAQLAELYADVWSRPISDARGERHA
jgi:hypothetical protein